MNYCEKCKIITESEKCERCNSTKLREVKEDDFCYINTFIYMDKEMLDRIFKNEEIPVVWYPVGINAALWAIRDSQIELFVPFKFFDKAIEIIEEFFN